MVGTRASLLLVSEMAFEKVQMKAFQLLVFLMVWHLDCLLAGQMLDNALVI